jgi:pilus assembly protein Flp/PilA
MGIAAMIASQRLHGSDLSSVDHITRASFASVPRSFAASTVVSVYRNPPQGNPLSTDCNSCGQGHNTPDDIRRTCRVSKATFPKDIQEGGIRMLQRAFQSIQASCLREEGATMVEYGLMVALIAIVCLVAVTALGVNIQGIFNQIAAAV